MQEQIALQMVVLAGVLGLVQMLLGSVAARTQQGYEWGLGPRDEPAPIDGIPARLQRAYANYLETMPIFMAVMLVAVLLDKVGALTYYGGLVYLVGRVVYVLLYAAGVPLWRTVVWIVAKGGLFAVLLAVLI